MVILGLVAFLAAGFIVGRWWNKDVRTLKRDLAATRSKLSTVSDERDWYQRNIEARDKSISQIAADRDKFRKMASTHEVKFPDPVAERKRTFEVWSGRRYLCHPEKLLAQLQEDLKPYTDKLVVLRLDLEGRGGWRPYLEEVWRDNYDRALSKINSNLLAFEGTGNRVFDQFRDFLRSVGHGFVRHDAQRTWKDLDSPVLVQAWMSVTEVTKAPPLPTIQIVEVPVVQVEPRIEIVERQIPVPLDTGVDPIRTMCYSDVDIIRLVRAVLEVEGYVKPALDLSATMSSLPSTPETGSSPTVAE
jgi:hypothetical protein